ncbi:MAG: DUF3540 domain-containing protein [Myxococcales bacterium]|nr:DUF3540 domain-containing protein [Myxococcales bacterium]
MTEPATTPIDQEEPQASPRSQEALVLQVDGSRLELRLRAGSSVQGHAAVVSARLAIPGYTPRPGDRVLVHSLPREGTSASEHYVIGVLHTAERSADLEGGTQDRLTAPTGAYAEHRGSLLSLFDSSGRLLVRYDSESGALELRSPADLHLSAPNGSVRLSAAEHVELRAPRATIDADELALSGRATQMDFGRLELRGERVLSRVAEAFIDVERVAETRAKRLRTLVESTLELIAQRTTIRSAKDTRIDGKRVLLG